jgi:RHS repeat-associated protein
MAATRRDFVRGHHCPVPQVRAPVLGANLGVPLPPTQFPIPGTDGSDPICFWIRLGSLTKSGSSSFLPTYNAATNRYASIPGGTPTYDANGNLTNDVAHSYTWDADSRVLSVDTVNLTYDALGRMVEQNRSGTYTQIVYSPTGGKLALMNGSTLVKAFVPLPGGTMAVYASSGLSYYRHSDWLGSSRLSTTPSRTKYYDVAYAPYGEGYAGSGTADLSYTGQNQDTASGIYDFLYREYNAVHGRWISPDPAGLGAVDFTSPQTWNRYAYVGNSPLNSIDPLGLFCQKTDGTACGQSTVPDPLAILPAGGCASILVDGIDSGSSTCGGDVWHPKPEVPARKIGKIEAPSGTTCPPVPPHPPQANLNANIEFAQWMSILTYTNPGASLYAFDQMVGNNKPWDYKQDGWTLTDTGQLGPSPFQDFGNFNFGAHWRSMGFPFRRPAARCRVRSREGRNVYAGLGALVSRASVW